MKLLSAKQNTFILLEEIEAQNSLYRIAGLHGLESFILGEIDFTPALDENYSLEDSGYNYNKVLVYKANEKFGYYKSFTRTLNPELIKNFFKSTNTVIIKFDKNKLKQIKDTKLIPIVYDVFNTNKVDEMEERLYSTTEVKKLLPNSIKTVYIAPPLLSDIKIFYQFSKNIKYKQ